MKKLNITYRFLLVLLLAGFTCVSALQAGHSDEEAYKLTQTSKYNPITGNWDVKMEMSTEDVAKEFKKYMPELEYALVDESTDDDNITMKFRGPGDQAVVIKLKQMGKETNVRIRIGVAGSEGKSSQLFTYIYKKM